LAVYEGIALATVLATASDRDRRTEIDTTGAITVST
jgi:hypothetical protein